jgi:hypothetical protein
MVHISALVSLLPVALAQTLPVKGVFHSEMGGIFGIGDRIPYVNFTDDIFFLFGGGSESPFRKSPKAGPQLKNGGSGPYKAGFTTDPTLPEHIIYAPKTPPVNVKLPVIVWGNWACFNAGEMFSVFLTEIASYGYLILANGKPGRDFLNFSTKTDPPNLSTINLWGPFGYAINETTKVQMLTDSIDWVTKGGAAKYGNIDTAHIAAAGHACGGLEAYATSYHDSRVKLTVLFNSGVILHNTTSLLKELKAPVGYFLGGPFDIAYPNVSI